MKYFGISIEISPSMLIKIVAVVRIVDPIIKNTKNMNNGYVKKKQKASFKQFFNFFFFKYKKNIQIMSIKLMSLYDSN